VNESDTQSPSYARFENFPRRHLTFDLSRRELFRLIFREGEVTAGRIAGGKGYNLAALGTLPDELIGQAKPEIIRGCRIYVRDDMVWGKPPGESERFLFNISETAALTVFNQFNGQSTIRQIASRLSTEGEWPMERCFTLVRGLFLTLVSYRLAMPAVKDEA
jgi:hypothetical protein